MTILNTSARYGVVSQFLHWLTVALVALLVIGGKAGDLEPREGGLLYSLHTSVGLLVAMLVALRLGWRVVTPPPLAPAGQSRLATLIAHGLHALFYLLLLALPLSGWLAACEKGGTVSFFGLGTLPVWRAAWNGEVFEEMHEVLGNLLLVLVALHVLAALKHHFIDKDAVLSRMLPGSRPAPGHAGSEESRAPRRTD
jgi:cytochrome b561